MERRIQLIVYRHEAAATVPSGLPAGTRPTPAAAARGSYFAPGAHGYAAVWAATDDR